MRAEFFIGAHVLALAEQMQIEFRQDRREAIGVLQLDQMLAELRAKTVGPMRRPHATGKQAGRMNALENSRIRSRCSPRTASEAQ